MSVPLQKRSTIARTSPRDGWKTRHRRAAPDEHTDVDPLRELAEQVSDRHRVFAASEGELRREVPARQVDVRRRSCEILCDARQEGCAVDEDLDLVSGARRCGSARPVAAVGRQRVIPAHLAETPFVVRDDGRVDRPTECVPDGRSSVRLARRASWSGAPSRRSSVSMSCDPCTSVQQRRRSRGASGRLSTVRLRAARSTRAVTRRRRRPRRRARARPRRWSSS